MFLLACIRYSKGVRHLLTPFKADTYLGSRCPPDPPLTASPRSLLANFDVLENTMFSNFALWEIEFMRFMTHRNLPETLGEHIQKHVCYCCFDICLRAKIVHLFQKILFAITASRASPRSKSRPDSKSS